MSDWIMPATTGVSLILGWLFFIRGKMASRDDIKDLRNDIKDLSKVVNDINTLLGRVEGAVNRLEH